jgi:hypothetical protein
MQHDNQPANKEEKWTRGNGTLQGGGSALREQEEVAVQQQRQRDNQHLLNKRQMEGKASADRGCVERGRMRHR